MTQRLHFPRQDALVGFESFFPLAEVSSTSVEPEGWAPEPEKLFRLDFQDEPGLTQLEL